MWYLLYEEFLRSIGFTLLPSDLSVLTNEKVIIGRIALAVYVDELLIASKDKANILCEKELLKAQFEVKDLGEVRIVLGIIARRYGQRMTLDQSQYAAVNLKRFLDDSSPPYLIPMEPDAVHRLADTGGELLNEERRSGYLQAIGQLMHSCHTRPDIIFSVNKLAQFSSTPYAIHKSALHRVLGYVKYTISFGIKYGGEQIFADLDYFTVDHNIIGYASTSKKEEMQAFSDADHASDPTDRKSIQGFVFTIMCWAVGFNSTKQRSVAGSTTEAEYIALSMASRQAIWTRRLVSSIEVPRNNLQFRSNLEIIRPLYNFWKESQTRERSNTLTLAFIRLSMKLKRDLSSCSGSLECRWIYKTSPPTCIWGQTSAYRGCWCRGRFLAAEKASWTCLFFAFILFLSEELGFRT